jgi:hypothetical protein
VTDATLHQSCGEHTEAPNKSLYVSSCLTRTDFKLSNMYVYNVFVRLSTIVFTVFTADLIILQL